MEVKGLSIYIKKTLTWGPLDATLLASSLAAASQRRAPIINRYMILFITTQKVGAATCS